MNIDATALDLLVASFATFLIGVNLGMLYRFWPEPWLSIKVIGVMGLLTYVSLSVLLGQPDQWRAAVGLAAVVIDFGAIGVVWYALEHARRGEEGVLVAYRRR